MRLLRTARRVLGIVILVLAMTAIVLLAVSQTAWFRDRLRGYAVQQATRYLRGELSIGRLTGNLFSGVVLHDVAIEQEGRPVVTARAIELDYSLVEVASEGLVANVLRIIEPAVLLQRDAAGRWNVADLVRQQEQEAEREGPARPITIRRLVVTNGRVAIEDETGGEQAVRLPELIESIDADASFSYEPVDIALRIARLDFEARRPDLSLRSLTGRFVVHEQDVEVADLDVRTAQSTLQGSARIAGYTGRNPRLDLAVRSGRITLRELTGLVPALAQMPLEPSLHLRAEGTLADLRVQLETASTAGALTADVRANLARMEHPSARGRVDIRNLNVARLVGDPSLESDVTGRMAFALAGRDPGSLGGTARVELQRSRAVGYQVESLTADAGVKGNAVDLDATVRAYGASLSAAGTVTMPPDLGSGGSAARGQQATGIGYDLSGRMLHVDLARLPLEDDQRRTPTDLNAAWSAQGRGMQVRARLRFDASRAADAVITAGTEAMVDLRGPVPAYALRGSVRNLDPRALARLAGRAPEAAERLAGRVNAVLDVQGRGVTPETIDARASVQAGGSEVGGIDVRVLDLRATMRDRVARVDALKLESPMLRANASGTVSMRPDQPSKLSWELEADDIAALATLAGVDQAGGTARMTGTLTGTQEHLAAEASLSASSLRYGETTAMSLSSNIEAQLPALDVEQARVRADTVATLVRAAGRDIREITLDVQYAARELGFDAAIAEPERTLEARGLARLLPDGQELRLDALSLSTGDTRWMIPEGSPATVFYRGRQIEIRDLALVNGGQRLTAEGTILLEAPEAGGEPAGRLALAAESVALDSLDDLTVGDRGLAGRLDAAATLTGPLADPVVEGTASVVDGAFRDFTFDQLTGSVHYDARGATFDLRLDQSAGVSLEAGGTAPPAMLRAGASRSPDAWPLDVRAHSTAIDLGVVQGLTPAVTDAAGTLALDLRVTGTPQAPQLNGDLTISGGAFSLPATGASYKGLDAAVRFEGSSARIERFQVLDDGEDALTADGTVALTEGMDGVVDLRVKADEFRLADNQLGRLQVNLDLLASGTLTSPNVTGEVVVHEGTIEVDRALEFVQSGLYSTEAVKEGAEEAVSADADTPGGPQFDVRIRVPDNLVVRGDNIRLGGRGTSLGDMNVTLGGDITATRAAGGEPTVVGAVRTIRGYYEFQGRRFEVERDGTIGFKGPDLTNPTLDVTAHRDIAGVRATVAVQGTAQQPRLVLSSSPPLEDADILSLIIFNRPVNDLAQGERASLSLQAQQLVGGAVASPLAESLRDVLDVDLLEIQAVAQGTTGPGVTVGQQLGERVFLQFRQLFGSAQQTEVVLEYELLEYLRLQTSFTEGSYDPQAAGGRPERAGVDLIFTVEPEK
ncbi:MAG TPA: translocation/assembly module TamB domain-containing protein [Vicinamibacterales bacterium]